VSFNLLVASGVSSSYLISPPGRTNKERSADWSGLVLFVVSTPQTLVWLVFVRKLPSLKMSEKQENDDPIEDQTGPEYKVSKKVTVNELLNLDQSDESLQKYKQSLGLGNATYSPKDDPRRVVIERMTVTCEGRPGGEIKYELETPEATSKLKDTPFILKEGCNYRITVIFRVQHEICSGLKYGNTVSRKGFKVAKDETMIGSFAPQKEPYTMIIPRHGWEEAPSGMLARGSYKAKSQFIDDDKHVHLEYEYAFEIKKDWQ